MGEVEKPNGYNIEEVLKSQDGVLTVAGARAVVFTAGAFTDIVRVLHEHSPHVLKYALYDMGYRTGESLVESLSVDYESPKKAFVNLVETYKQSGYGDIEVKEFDPEEPRARIVGTNLFESGLAADSGVFRTPRAADFYSRGMFAGFMSKLFGKEIICEELKCQFRGDDKCEFVVMPLAID